MEIDVHFIIEIKPNLLILLQKHYDESFDDMEGDDKYLISIYNIENKSLKQIFKSRVDSIMGEYNKINFIMSQKYLFMCYGKTMEIFNLEKNMEIVDIENCVYEYERIYGNYQRIMSKEKRIIKVLANYSDTLFFGKDDEGKLNLYIFKDNTLNIYYNFINDGVKGVIKLKNNDFILYSYDCQLYIFTPVFSNNN